MKKINLKDFIPPVIFLMGFKYRVILCKPDDKRLMKIAKGERISKDEVPVAGSDLKACEIYLAQGWSAQQTLSNLMHEVGHILFPWMSERRCIQFEEKIFAFFCDNNMFAARFKP